MKFSSELRLCCRYVQLLNLKRTLTAKSLRFAPHEGQAPVSSKLDKLKQQLANGPQLADFIAQDELIKKLNLDPNEPFVAKRPNRDQQVDQVPYVSQDVFNGRGRTVYIETYGCQMNVNDTQIAQKILAEHNYTLVDSLREAQVVLLMTCSIREGAEQKIWTRLRTLKKLKTSDTSKVTQIGLLGCMAERLKTKLLDHDKLVDVVCGPDAYRDLPKLLAINNVTGQNAVNVLLSLDETYADVMPTVAVGQGHSSDIKDSKSVFISIMRGCDNMCTYCIVPFTRGKERSRPLDSIVDEVRQVAAQGVKEVTLLGQNVNSYRDKSVAEAETNTISLPAGFSTVYKPKRGGRTFDVLLEQVALADPEVRIRFTSPHPKDFADEVISVIKKYPNVCKCIHIPAQSGSNQVLERMRRGYTREAYMELIDRIRQRIPGVAFTSDFISGFCGETEADHELTLDLIERVKYNFVYFFPYSMREVSNCCWFVA